MTLRAVRATGTLCALAAVGLALAGLLAAWPGAPVYSAQPVLTTATPLPLYALPDARTNAATSSRGLAQASESGLLVIANGLSNTASVVAPRQRTLIAEVAVGREPRSVAITPDGTRALVTNYADGTLSILSLSTNTRIGDVALGGVWPYGVVADGNSTAYVALMGSNQIAVVDLDARQVVARVPTPGQPAGLALWGDFLYVTHFWRGALSLVYIPRLAVVSTVDVGAGLSQAVEVDVTRGLAYLPATRAYAENPAPTYDSTAFPVVNVVRLSALTLTRAGRVPLETRDRPVNMPFDAEVDPFRNVIYIANAGSDSVTVFDIGAGRTRAHIRVGANPRNLLLSRDGTGLYVLNALDGTLSVIDVDTLRVTDTLPVTDLTTPVDLLLGAQRFHSAADGRMAAGGWLSCATCHFGGQSDGRVWQGAALDGPRTTPTLFNLTQTAPYGWNGQWDDLGDTEIKVRLWQGGRGLIAGLPTAALDPANPHVGVSPDLDTLVAYMQTLRAPDSPFPPTAEQAARGEAVFIAQGCAGCHTPPAWTNGQAYDVGTGGTFDTPTLRALWQSAPYYHDGRAATLEDVFAGPGVHGLAQTLPAGDVAALVAYLRGL